MPQPNFNNFVSFDLNEDEQKAAETLHVLHTCWFQNLRAIAAQDLLNLEVPILTLPISDAFIKHMLDKAHLDGQIKILSYILEIAANRNNPESSTHTS